MTQLARLRLTASIQSSTQCTPLAFGVVVTSYHRLVLVSTSACSVQLIVPSLCLPSTFRAAFSSGLRLRRARQQTVRQQQTPPAAINTPILHPSSFTGYRLHVSSAATNIRRRRRRSKEDVA
eukprot:scaffold33090_cov38-Cyclotella_meneghiniana.AAC.6